MDARIDLDAASRGFPRTRGDRPVARDLREDRHAVPPHTRG